MIIEFTGCSGSGKTTISERVIQKLEDSGCEIVTNHSNRFLEGMIRNHISNPTIQNLIMDVIALSMVIIFINRYNKLLHFAAKILINHDVYSIYRKLNAFRSIVRKIGNYEFFHRRRFLDKIVIIDEGTVHATHVLFSSPSYIPVEKDIIQFAELVPMPDCIIYVHASKEILLKRTLSRKDRLARFNNDVEAEKFITYAVNNVFEKLISQTKIYDKLFIIDYSENDSNLADKLAEEVVDYIKEKAK